MIITEEKILSNIDKVQTMINPNNKKQIIQLEEDAYFKDLIDSIKTYLIEYPKKKNFPASVYKAAYGLVEYATNQFEENTKKIEDLIIQREKNIELSVKLKELLDVVENKEKDWKNQLKPVLFAPETLLANKMMRRLLAEKRSAAIVVDEFGGTAGLVTLEDLVEEIFGDIQDEHDNKRILANEIAPGVYEFSGRIEIAELNETYHLNIPEEDEYQTLAGYILYETGTIPAKDTSITLGGLTFEIVKKSATRLEIIRITKPQNDEAQQN